MSNVFQNLQLQRIANAIEDGAVSGSITIDVTGAGDMQPATATAAGYHGLVPAPQAGDENKVLSGAGVWVEAGGGELGELEDVTITSPTSGESLKYDGTKWVNGNITAELPDFIEEASGSIVTVEAAERPAKSLVIAIEPQQDLHGYDSPWVGGAGKNKLDVPDGSISQSGYIFKFENLNLPAGKYTLNLEKTATADLSFAVVTGETTPLNNLIRLPYSFEVTNTITGLRLFSTNATNYSKVQLEQGATATSFAPYSNICQISGWTWANVVVSPTIDAEDGQTYHITFPTEAGTVYGGTLDVTNGVLTVTKANIASYDGETLPGAWISDRDVYAEGTTPTTGAQVVYDLDTPITYQLTPTVVQMLLGTNNIWADTGEVKELRYISQTYNDLINEVSGGSGTTYTVLSDTTQTTNAWVNPIVVSCNPFDYDVIIFDITDSGEGKYYCITFPQTLPLDNGDGQSTRQYVLSNHFSCFPARLSNGMGMFTSTNITLNVNKVTGIKFGGIL